VALSDKTRGCGHKLKHRRLPVNIRKCFFTVRVAEHRHRLPREVVDPHPLRYSKAIWTQFRATYSKWLCWPRGVGPDDLQRSFPTSASL